MEILKMRFSILHTFHQISRTFYFLSDLDLAGDLDLCPCRAVKVGFDPKQIDNSNFLFLYDYLFPVMYRVRRKMF